MSSVSHEEILRVHGAALSAALGDRREALLSTLPLSFVATLPTAKIPADQLLLDIATLNNCVELVDGTNVLLAWLRNAIALAQHRPETVVFEDYVERLSRATTTALGHVVGALPGSLEQAAREREKQTQQWDGELRRVVPELVTHLETRLGNVEERINEVFRDPQVRRLYTNFTYEAAREALDERRRMLAHAAAGLADPEMTVERKARVERTIRELDPIDVLTLHGGTLIPHRMSVRHPGVPLAVFLRHVPSGDVLSASGCVRMEAGGGGAGEGVWTHARVTSLGYDVLSILKTYTRRAVLPFAVPGRERGENDLPEAVARRQLNRFPTLGEFVAWTLRRTSGVRGTSYRCPSRPEGRGTLTFYLPDWTSWEPRLQTLSHDCMGLELEILMTKQPFQTTSSEPSELLRVEISGPHDMLRWLADDCEAHWNIESEPKSA